MNLLHLNTGIQGDSSVSRQLSRAVIDRFMPAGSPDEVTYRDLVAEPIAHLTGPVFAAQGAEGEPDPALGDDAVLGRRVLDEFLAADVVVIGVSFYNFGIPSQLKAWVDRVTVAGRTFRYTDKGPQGLAGDKRVVLAIARGGFYGPGSGREGFEHAETYLKALFSFLGVTRIDVVAANGVKAESDRAIADAMVEVNNLVVL